jgi:hypothetical protein
MVLFSLKFNIYQNLYMFVYLVLLKSTINLTSPRVGQNEFIYRQGVGGGEAQELRKTQKLPQKVSDGKKITINYSCALSLGYNNFNNLVALIH